MRMLALAAIAALSACATRPTEAERAAVADAADHAKCVSWGVTLEDSRYAECRVAVASLRLQQEQLDAENRAAAHARKMQRSAALRAVATTLQNQAAAAAPAEPVRCTSVKTGNTTNTTCR